MNSFAQSVRPRKHGGGVAQRSPRAPLMVGSDASRRTLEDLTGGPALGGLGDLTVQAISSTASLTATGAMLGSVVPVVGTAIGAAIGAGIGFLSSLFGSSAYHKAEAQTTVVANTIGAELASAAARYNSGMHTYSEQQAAIAYFDQLWAGLVQGCSGCGKACDQCIADRQQGGRYSAYPYRDAIVTDPKVVADPGYQLVIDPTVTSGVTSGPQAQSIYSCGQLVGEVPVGECPPFNGMLLVPVGQAVGNCQPVPCSTSAVVTTVPTVSASGGNESGSTAPVTSAVSTISILGMSINPLVLVGAAVAVVLVMSMGGDGK